MLLSILSVLALANKVIGWGDKGHSAVGYIAMEVSACVTRELSETDTFLSIVPQPHSDRVCQVDTWT